MSISSRSRSLRAHSTQAPQRRGISLDRRVDFADARDGSVPTPGFFLASDVRGPLGIDDQPFADAQTLRDLDLFAQQAGEPSLFALLDRTRTAGGRKSLIQLLSSGNIDSVTIETRQAAIRYFSESANRDRWSLRSSDRAVTHLERYLDSYVVPLSGMRGPIYWVRALWYRTSYAKYFEYLDSCIRTLHRFLRALQEARAEQEEELPLEIARCRQAIDRLLDHEVVVAFLRGGRNHGRFRPARMLHFDELFRRKLAPLTRDTLEAIHRIDLFLALGRATEDLSLVFPKFVKARGGGDKGSQDDRTDGRTAARTEAARRGDEGNPDDDTGGTSSSTENESFVRTFPPNDPGIVCEGLFHPFLVEPVPNDIRLDTEQGFIFLTGPNMAGKTTLMKALGLAVYMAHLGLPVPCRSMRLALLDGVFSSLSVEDNLGKGYSFFYAEVRRVKDVAEQLHHGRHLLVLFDELFKGTNLKDALDGSRLVVDGFRGFPGSLFVLSSHLLELGEELVEFGEELIEPEAGPKVAAPFRIPIRFQRFDADVHEGQPRFSYILRDGVSTERLGMLILQNEGIPDLLRSPSRKKREKGRNSPAPIRDESDTRPGLRTDA